MKKANTRIIGAFILGACALFIAGVLVSGSLYFMHPHPVGVAYFPDNGGGLNTGAPVNFRGVQIGTVKEIDVEVDPRSFDARIPIYIEFEPERSTTKELRKEAATCRRAASIPGSGSSRADQVLLQLAEKLESEAAAL